MCYEPLVQPERLMCSLDNLSTFRATTGLTRAKSRAFQRDPAALPIPEIQHSLLPANKTLAGKQSGHPLPRVLSSGPIPSHPSVGQSHWDVGLEGMEWVMEDVLSEKEQHLHDLWF